MKMGYIVFMLLLLIAPSMAIVVSPEKIETIIANETIVNVKIENDENESVYVNIRSNSEFVNPSNSLIGLSKNESINITLRIIPANIDTIVVYSTNSSSIVQNVSIRDSKTYTMIISPKEIEIPTTTNTTEVKVEIYNPTDVEGRVTVLTPLNVTERSLVLDPKERNEITITAPVGTYDVVYHYSFKVFNNSINGTIVQKLRVVKDKRILDLESEVNKLTELLYLPDNIVVVVPDRLIVGEVQSIVVKSGNKPLSGVPIQIGEEVKFTDSSGLVVIKPTSVGPLKISVLDRLGNIKTQKIVFVEKGEFKFSIPDVRVGKPITVDFPEAGVVSVYLDGRLLFTTTTNETHFDYVPDYPGEYTIKYNSTSYSGETSFVVNSGVEISALVNGKPATLAKPGDTIEFRFTYENGVPVKSGTAIVSVPMTLFGYDKKDAILFAFAGGPSFEPPYNYKIKMKITGGKITLDIPESAVGGIIKVELEGGDSQTIIKIEENPSFIDAYGGILAALIIFIGFVGAIIVNEDLRMKVKKQISKLRRGEDELV